MRRRVSGLLLPGLILTLLAVAGVALLLLAGAPVVPRHLPGLPVNAQDERRSVLVAPSHEAGDPPTDGPAAATPTPSHSPDRAPAATATARPTGTRAADPTRGAAVSSAPAGHSTRSDAPSRPATTSPAPKEPGCAAGSATVAAAADTYVDQASPGQSFGGDASLLVASRDRDRNRRALVRFALPAIPSGCTLQAATLTLTAEEATGRRLLVSRADRAWTESVTWSAAPGPAGSAIGATVGAASVSWSVTSLVATMRTSGNYGFLLRDASEGARGAGEQTIFGARTSQAGPTLTVRWS